MRNNFMCPQEELVRHIFRFASDRIRSIQPNIYPIEGREHVEHLKFNLSSLKQMKHALHLCR